VGHLHLRGVLILTGIKMIVKREEEIHPERNPLVRWFKKLMP
jgi:tellurite resistance protein TerC